MLLDIEKTDPTFGAAIENVIRALDPTAQITVDVGASRVRVEGLLNKQQVIHALATAGYPASLVAPHSGEGSDCCGGCS